MKWIEPAKGSPSWRWYVTSECGQWRICESRTNGVPVYTLSHRGVLVMSGSLESCKGRADETAKRQAAA